MLLTTNQFDDLDKHPIVGGGGENVKELGSQWEIIHRISKSKFAQYIDCGGYHTSIIQI